MGFLLFTNRILFSLGLRIRAYVCAAVRHGRSSAERDLASNLQYCGVPLSHGTAFEGWVEVYANGEEFGSANELRWVHSFRKHCVDILPTGLQIRGIGRRQTPRAVGGGPPMTRLAVRLLKGQHRTPATK